MRALVLGGGGSKGSYQVGVLKCLMGDQGRDYEIICGVSVGALNSAALSQGRLGKPWEAYGKLSDLWDEVSNRKIRKFWFLWHLAALWKPSVYDSSPLRKWVESSIDVTAIRASERRVRVGAVNWDSGEFKVADETSPDLRDWILASSSFPGFFTPIKIGGQEWADGGIRNITPLGEAIRAGATEIDVIMCSNPDLLPPWKARRRTVLWRLLRAIELAFDEITRGDLKEAGLKNDLAKLTGNYRDVKIRVIQPSRHLDVDSLDFDPKGIRRMREIGYEDALHLA